jgi:phage regulator Rha-like protein
MWNQSIENHKSFFDDSTSLFRDEFIEESACPACQKIKVINYLSKKVGNISNMQVLKSLLGYKLQVMIGSK